MSQSRPADRHRAVKPEIPERPRGENAATLTRPHGPGRAGEEERETR